MVTPPFGRTTCDCADCVAACRRQPGYLIPGDLERIAAHLGEPVEEVAARCFWSSEGAVAMDTATGRQFRLRTITPRYNRHAKACVFLKDDRCTIHAVAPFGCAYFDTHMSASAAQPRTVWGMTLVRDTPEYTAQRQALPFADHYKPLKYR